MENELTTTHAQGPHVDANMLMLMQMKAIMAETAALFVSAPLSWPTVTPTMPTIYWEMTIPVPPKINKLRRPNLSTIQNEMGVDRTLTRVVIKLMRKGFWIVLRLVKKTTPAWKLASCSMKKSKRIQSEIDPSPSNIPSFFLKISKVWSLDSAGRLMRLVPIRLS
jgi:hypothetical protein